MSRSGNDANEAGAVGGNDSRGNGSSGGGAQDSKALPPWVYEMRSSMVGMRNQIDSLNVSSEEQKAEISVLTSSMKQQASEIKELTLQISALQTEIANKDAKIKELEEKLAKKDKEKHILAEKYEKLAKKENHILAEKYENSKAEGMQAARDEVALWKKKLEEETGVRQAMEQKLEKMQVQMHKLEENLQEEKLKQREGIGPAEEIQKAEDDEETKLAKKRLEDEKAEKLINGRIDELRNMASSTMLLLTDAGPGRLPRFRSKEPPDFVKMYAAELSPDSRVAIISVAGVECLEKKCLTLLVLRYLQYLYIIKDCGRAPSRHGFFSFLRKVSAINMQSFQLLVTPRGLNIWQHPFKVADNLVVFLLCAVGAFDIDLVSGGISPLLCQSVLCSCVQLVHLAASPAPGVNELDCLRMIMTSTDFLIYSDTDMAKLPFPQLGLLISDKGELSTTTGCSVATSSNGSMLARARDAIGRNQVELFRAGVFPAGRCQQVHCKEIGADVTDDIFADLQVERHEPFLSSVYDLCERAIGKANAMPALKFDLNGCDVTLRELARFLRQVYKVPGLSEEILKSSGPAEQAWANVLRGKQLAEWRDFVEREKQARNSIFTTSDGLKMIWEKDTSNPDKSVLGKWRHRHRLIREKCQNTCDFLYSSLWRSIMRGGITADAKYIEARNSRLDVTQLLNGCLKSESPIRRLLPQYRHLEFCSVWWMFFMINMSDNEWSKLHATFAQISRCRRNAQELFDSQFSSLVSKTSVGDSNCAALRKQVKKLPAAGMRKFNDEIASECGIMQLGDQKEFDLIVCDQRSLLQDWMEWWVTACNTMIEVGVNGSFLYPRDKVFTIDSGFTRYLETADTVAFCVRCLPIYL